MDKVDGRLHSRAMVPVKSVAVQVNVAVPASPERVIGGKVQLTLAGGRAMPESVTCCGLPLALSGTLNVAVSDPTERLGVNVTLMTQLPPAATVVPHGLVCAKSAAFVPVIPMPVPVMFSAAPPVLDSVTVCAAEVVPDTCDAKLSDVRFRLAIGIADMVMEKLAEAVLPVESVTVMVTAKGEPAAVVGVPETTPVVMLMPSPAGSPVALQV